MSGNATLFQRSRFLRFAGRGHKTTMQTIAARKIARSSIRVIPRLRDSAKATGASSTVAMLTASDPNDRQSALLSGTPHPEGGDNPQIA